MRISILLLCICTIIFNSLCSQPCSIEIKGNSCLGTTLTAKTDRQNLSQVKWFNYGNTVFVADTITSSESVSIVAGGRGSGSASNQFGFPPGGLAIDASNNIYVADQRNNRIQKWAPGASFGTTVAGGHGPGVNANQLNSPADVFIDQAGNIYVADNGNNRIQKWLPGAASGITVAGGNGAGNRPNQLNAPNGLYVDENENIYIADKYNYRIQKWKAGATHGTTVAGGTPGAGPDQFGLPVDVYLDADKNIYVADANTDATIHHRVQKWLKGATYGITVAGGNGVGDAADQFNYITALFVTGKGDIYVADAGNRRVSKWSPGASGGVTVAGGYGNGTNLRQLHYTTGVCLDTAKNIIVMDGGTYAVKQFIPTHGLTENHFLPTQAGSYKVEAIFKDGCTATSDPFMVYSVPQSQIKTSSTGSRTNLCQGGIDTFYVDPWDNITSVKWRIPKSCSLLATKTDSIILQVPLHFSDGYIINRSTNVCGTNYDTLRIVGKPAKPQPIIGPSTVAAGATNISYRVEDKGFNYHWQLPAGVTAISGQDYNSVTVNWGSEGGSISVVAANECGTSQAKEKYISVANSKPATNDNQLKEETLIFAPSLMVYPDPVHSHATVAYTATKMGIYIVQVLDISGRVVSTRRYKLLPGHNLLALDLSGYLPGVYTIVVSDGQKHKNTVKVIKQ